MTIASASARILNPQLLDKILNKRFTLILCPPFDSYDPAMNCGAVFLSRRQCCAKSLATALRKWNAQMVFSGHGNLSSLLRNDDGNAVTHLTDADSCLVARTRFWTMPCCPSTEDSMSPQ